MVHDADKSTRRQDMFSFINYERFITNSKTECEPTPNPQSSVLHHHPIDPPHPGVLLVVMHAACYVVRYTAAQAKGQCTDQATTALLVSLSHLFRVS